MRSDRIFARILLVISVANVALAAPAAVRQRYLEVAKAASEKRGSGSGSDGGETSDLPPEPSSPMPSHDLPIDKSKWDLFLWPGLAKSSPAAEDRITTQASGTSGSGNGATSDLPPESSSPMPPDDHISTWLHDTDPVPPSPASTPKWSKSPSTSLSGIVSLHSEDVPPSIALFDTSPLHSGDLPLLPHQAAPEADQIFSDSLKRKLFGVAGIIAGVAALGVGIQQTIKHLYVSPLPPFSPADI